MEGMRLLHKLRLTNFLSYGPEGTEIELQPLNVLIGPNGSGKSNLIEAISLLKAAPTDISRPIREGGGMTEWTWKGNADIRSADLDLRADLADLDGRHPLRYILQLRCVGQNAEVAYESVGYECLAQDGTQERHLVYEYRNGLATLTAANKPTQELRNLNARESVLSQRRDPEAYPEVTLLGELFRDTEMFRDLNFGPRSLLRGPQRADQPSGFLLDDGRNLGCVLNNLLNFPTFKKRLVSELKRFHEYAEDVTTRVVANTVESFVHERGFFEATPSQRLSDGALHYLCLLTILCHPAPPPLVCIEDPEVGLHPDILPIVADLLVEASEQMQLIVTTHSDILVSALSHVPEAVVVCERDDRGSHLRRLDTGQLREWLKNYSLGELWICGEIGGNS